MSTAGQVIQCKAAVAWEPGKPLSIEDVEVAPPKVHEVRIKIVATGVCHTDLAYLYEAGIGMTFRPFPLVLGHEAAGIVESIGPEVTKFSPGDKVIPLFLPQCGECERCRSPKTNHCRKNWANTQVGVLADGTSRISCKGQQVYQFLGVSSFSQYTVVPDTSLAKIRSDAPLHKVCLLGCGVSTGYGAAINTGKVEKGSSCAVFGLGAVGLAAVMGCKVAGATRIIGVDINSAKFEKAKEFGATECVNPTKFSKPIQESAAFESTIDAWGTCVIVGWTETEAMSIVVEKILMGRTLKGTYFGGKLKRSYQTLCVYPLIPEKKFTSMRKVLEALATSQTCSVYPSPVFRSHMGLGCAGPLIGKIRASSAPLIMYFNMNGTNKGVDYGLVTLEIQGPPLMPSGLNGNGRTPPGRHGVAATPPGSQMFAHMRSLNNTTLALWVLTAGPMASLGCDQMAASPVCQRKTQLIYCDPSLIPSGPSQSLSFLSSSLGFFTSEGAYPVTLVSDLRIMRLGLFNAHISTFPLAATLAQALANPEVNVGASGSPAVFVGNLCVSNEVFFRAKPERTVREQA
ncbi:hypothetical protein FQN60_010002, partial [Etheostoma spectabile]